MATLKATVSLETCPYGYETEVSCEIWDEQGQVLHTLNTVTCIDDAATQIQDLGYTLTTPWTPDLTYTGGLSVEATITHN